MSDLKHRIKMGSREWAADLFREAIQNCKSNDQLHNQIEFCRGAALHLLGTILFNETKDMGKANRFTALQNVKELLEEELEFMDEQPTDLVVPNGDKEEDNDDDKIIH